MVYLGCMKLLLNRLVGRVMRKEVDKSTEVTCLFKKRGCLWWVVPICPNCGNDMVKEIGKVTTLPTKLVLGFKCEKCGFSGYFISVKNNADKDIFAYDVVDGNPLGKVYKIVYKLGK